MTGHPQADNNLHRWLAPISDSAWQQIEEEAARTVKRSLAARRVIDVSGPLGDGDVGPGIRTLVVLSGHTYLARASAPRS